MAKKKDDKAEVAYPPEFAELFEKIPAKDVDTAVAVCKKLIAGGPATIKKLIDLVGPEFGLESGVKPKFALHGVVVYAARPGAPAERKMVAETLAAELAGGRSKEAKAFLCRQLQLCGRAEEVPALAKLLADDRLCEPATQAMLAIGGPEAAGAFRKALPSAPGKRKVTILKAAGRLADKPSAAVARKAAGDAERDVRLVAYYALGNMPDAEAVDLMVGAAGKTEGFEHQRAVAETLRLARRLGETGDAAAAKAVRGIQAAAAKAKRPHEAAAALHDLAVTQGAQAVGEVMAAMSSDDLWVRNAAARTAVTLAGALRKAHADEAKALLKKVTTATQEGAVVQQAELMLAGTI